MRFDDQQTFAYEKDFFVTGSIRDLWLPDDGTHDRFAMSGLADYHEALLITHEWYVRAFPQLSFKEMKPPQDMPMDDLYNEPASRHKDFTRILGVPAKIEQDKVSLRRNSEGPERKQGMRIWMGLMNLMELDYWPRIGDEFTYRNVLYEVSLVHVDPADYWQQSGWPIHISVTAKQVQLGDWPLHQSPHDRLTDTGAGQIPIEGVPLSPPMDSQSPGLQGEPPNQASAGDPGDSDGAPPETPFVDLPPPDGEYC